MKSFISSRSKVLVGGHRGCKCQFEENTLAAFEQAFRTGADYIETDIQLTNDHHPVIRHDLQFHGAHQEPRTVFDFCYEDLRTQHSILHVDELFHWLSTNSNYRAALDIKKQPDLGESESKILIDALLEKIIHNKLASQVLLFSIDHLLMRYAKEREASVTTGIIVPNTPDDPVGVIRNSKANLYLSRVANLTPAIVQSLHEHNYFVSGGDINGYNIATAIRYGVDMFETDYPEQVGQFL